jgi:hypothetical protein
VSRQSSGRNGFEVVSLSLKIPDSLQQSTNNNGGDQTKSMLYQQVWCVTRRFRLSVIIPLLQADSNMRETLIVLRQENSQLSMEIIELKGDISLRDDQVRV